MNRSSASFDLGHRRGDDAIQPARPDSRLIGASPAHAAMLDQLARIAQSDAPALIEGETGSGKELAARAIHYEGPRRSGPFVPVNCGALPDSLIESELFGVQRGAFTDARQSRRGLVAEAEGGTLFLDEADALSPKAQVTLLRFLQDQHFRPVGTAREQRTDVRVIAAANRPLDALVAQQAFRADLMYRLKILHLVLPPLRERGADVELLADRFIARFAARYACDALPLHPLTRQWLRSYPWPGNVRELENWVHRQVLMCRGPSICHDGIGDADLGVFHIGDQATSDGCSAESAASPQQADAAPAPMPTPCTPTCFAQAKIEAVERFERAYLHQVLQASGGNVTRAARMAGKERRAFGKLLKKHGIAAQATAHTAMQRVHADPPRVDTDPPEQTRNARAC